MGTDGDPPAEKKRKFPWKKPYAKMSLQEVEERIGVSMIHLGSSVIAPKDMLVAAGYKFEEVSDVITTAKNEVYKQIERYIAVEVPSLDLSNFMEPNVNELVYSIISPIIYEFRHKTGREDVKLFREKPIISTDLETGGFEEFVVELIPVDYISVDEERFVLVVEGKEVFGQ
ncbi:hypothetical protein L211DRAFT_826286 [Terfezia boudieri ATCC MYA-4762]|uniref:Uncharacterized protein n=1 Tax=Terfezia boudieri ATCC MYA-4762 TaxID=1051890 RepID=A0A3N4LIU1_9PEZI|nr:hypothetical protein L211DRAFT_826286 [Terfezia boudieri ATCC MYA-4762]